MEPSFPSGAHFLKFQLAWKEPGRSEELALAGPSIFAPRIDKVKPD